MKLYRFSPIQDKKTLIEAITYTHIACHNLCKQSFGKYLSTAGNVSIFCHYGDEFEQLKQFRKELTQESDNVDQKFFRFHEPLVIPAQEEVPETTYMYLYVRRPDPYRYQVGDIDFVLEDNDYTTLKSEMQKGKEINGARLFDRPDLDMIELYDPDVDALGYVSTPRMTDMVRVKQSEITKL